VIVTQPLEGEGFWVNRLFAKGSLCYQYHSSLSTKATCLPSTSLRSAQGEPRLALRLPAAARVEGSQLQIHVLSGNVSSGKNFFFRLSLSEIEQE
jgi:hypothetical protein